MLKKIVIKSGEYYDSITLLQVSQALLQTKGVKDAAVVMGTQANKDLLLNAGLLTSEGNKAQTNDLMITVLSEDEISLANAMNEAERLLKKSRMNVEKNAHGKEKPKTIAEAIKQMPKANLAFISVAGCHAATLARQALSEGLHVFIFSDNVSLKDEIALKTLGFQKELFVMGPDAGTAIINRVALGFANKVSDGEIGIVSAAGTGLQSVASTLTQLGVGISQAIGVGGRDISQEVGGMMMLQGLKALQEDPATKVIVIISKPPAKTVYEKIIANVKASKKSTVVCFLGDDFESYQGDSILKAQDLEEAAYITASIIKNKSTEGVQVLTKRDLQLKILASELKKVLKPMQKYFRGLFCGGSFCYETQMLLNRVEGLGSIYSNAPLDKKNQLQNANKSFQHTVLDLGDDAFTAGRLHPMLDSTIRRMRLLQESHDPTVAIIYLDFILGFGIHEDPVGSIQEALIESQKIAAYDNREIIYLASICGTEGDPQNLRKQEMELKKLNVTVLPSNAAAAKLAGFILS